MIAISHRGPRPLLWLALALAACFLVYRPGISGTFQFDDYSNLGALEQLQDDPTANAVEQYVLKGIASPVGRPLSLLTFAAQAQAWPDDPAAFITFNILLHLVNGALLFWWLRLLLRLRGSDPAAGDAATGTAALLACALWLLAPIQATSVLYVIQRMTELAATFVFLGLGLYLCGRERLARGETRAGLAWMSAGLAVGAGLGTLAKENAAQMPLMVLAIEFTLLHAVARPRAWRLWAMPFLFVPAAALLGYLVWVAVTATGYAGRDFTLAERLLTEPRALFMYLHKIVAPWPSAVRLWYDDFPLSRGLFEPWTTALALAGLFAAGAAAWFWRRAAPAVAFAVLWFLACHVLESSTIALELVFEHRNYQASVGPLLALALGAAFAFEHASSPLARRVFIALCGVYLLLQAAVTTQIALMWGRPLDLAAWMAQRLPESKRAQLGFATALMREQLPFDAAAALDASARRWPDDPSFALLKLTLSCQVAQIPLPAPAPLLETVRTTTANANAVTDQLDNLVSLLEYGRCTVGLPLPPSELTGAAVANPALRNQRQNQLLLHSRALRIEDRDAEALEVFARAIDARPQMILLIQGILDAVNAGDLALARAYLERARTDPRIGRRDRWVHRHDLPLLEDLIRSRESAPQ